jgi:hypothetical protein
MGEKGDEVSTNRLPAFQYAPDNVVLRTIAAAIGVVENTTVNTADASHRELWDAVDELYDAVKEFASSPTEFVPAPEGGGA